MQNLLVPPSVSLTQLYDILEYVATFFLSSPLVIEKEWMVHFRQGDMGCVINIFSKKWQRQHTSIDATFTKAEIFQKDNVGARGWDILDLTT